MQINNNNSTNILNGVSMTIVEELKNLIVEGESLRPHGGDLFNGYNSKKQPEYVSWRLKAITSIESLGSESKFLLKEIEKDKYSSVFLESSVGNLLGVLNAALSLALKKGNMPSKKQIVTKNQMENLVFIVHGRDDALLQRVARFLESLEIKPIILFEQAGKGQTIIEKLEANSNVGFAIVLLTPDDLGRIASSDKELNPRARQNVILELGYFIGKLGRNFVGVLYDESVELPSDYRGVEYIKLDLEGAWKMKIAKEMKEAGLTIDMNKAI